VVAAVVGVRNQAGVAAATSDYKTVSAEEADAARLAEADDSNQYTTVFSKIGSKNTKSASQETSIKEKIMNVVSQPFLFPLIVALGGILSLNLIKQN
jgi:membrane-bound ClpP family serine protease